tara:strand:- start:365 stop:766 length:402 start_codon:yes stop_codon:yes gene_type:complete
MRIHLLKSKLHRAIVTDVHLDYEGSCAIDADLMEAALINEYEMLHIYNLANGNRFTTYAIKAERGSGIVSLNGAAAHQGNKDDFLIICTYIDIESSEVELHKPKLVYLRKDKNVIDDIRSKISEQKKDNIINL